MTINFKAQDMHELKPRITVFGVGGAGGNAVNNMIESGLQGVEFVVANTDSQALMSSSVERRIQMGVSLTEGLGAGSHPEVGRSAAEEAVDEIREQLAGSHMAFITAGMGGGTGTGSAPVVARTAREQGILTVGVVTKPFQFEGQRRMRVADGGIEEMHKFVDTLIVIPNQNLFRVANEKTTFADAFSMADEVLYSGVACITDLIVKEGLINLDFADVRAVMSEMGKAMMGTGEAAGEKRATEAAEAAIANPLLDDVSMQGARGLLISITGGSDLTLYEVDEAASRVREQIDSDANVILGATFDESLEGTMRVSVVATGIDKDSTEGLNDEPNIIPMTENVRRIVETKTQVTAPVAVPNVEKVTINSTQEKETVRDSVATTQDGITLRPFAEQTPAPEPKVEPKVAKVAEEQVSSEPYVVPVPQQPVTRSASRIPRIEDFPVTVQTEARIANGDAENQENPVLRKNAGLLERLKGIGLAGRTPNSDEDEAGDSETQLQNHMPAPQPNPQVTATQQVHPQASAQSRVENNVEAAPSADNRIIAQNTQSGQNNAENRVLPQSSQPIERHFVANVDVSSTNNSTQRESSEVNIDDQLEIPAFLRRQSS